MFIYGSPWAGPFIKQAYAFFNMDVAVANLLEVDLNILLWILNGNFLSSFLLQWPIFWLNSTVLIWNTVEADNV